MMHPAAPRWSGASVEGVLRHPLVFAVSIAACYRDQPAPVTNTTTPAPLQVSCAADDRVHPPRDASPGSRLRTQSEGVLSGAGRRRWTGIDIPDHVPKSIGTLELFLLDPADGGHLAFYREPYDVGRCTLSGHENCRYEARFYDARGTKQWALRLDRVLSRKDRVEIQDIRLAGGVLYFNEACQSYSREAGGQCSALVAVEPREGRVLWRTAPLVSNGRFVIRGCAIVAGYGFTSERDAVFLVDRRTGEVLAEHGVASAPEQYALQPDDQVHVTLYSGALRRYQLARTDGRAVLQPLDPPDLGGASYGGASYGGASYGGRRP